MKETALTAAPPAPAETGAGSWYYVRAVRKLESLVYDGESENMRALLGGVCRDAAAYREALEDLGRFLLAQPRFAWAHALRGKAHLNLGELGPALAALSEALKLDPGLLNAYLWRAQTLVVAGEHARAEQDIARALAIGGGHPWAYFLRGFCRMSQGKVLQGRRDWERMLRWAPGSVAARSMIALSWAGAGKPARALRGLEAAARSGGGDAPYAWALKGMVERQMGKLNESLDSLKLALRKDPSPWILSHSADVLNRMGFYEEALKDLAAMSTLAPESAEADAQAANVLFDQAFYDDAIAAMTRAVAKRPGDVFLEARRARMLLVAGQDGAVGAIDRARALAPEDPHLLMEWLQIRVLSGSGSEAARELRRRRWAGHPMRSLLLGVLDCRARRFARARRSFLEAERAAARRSDPRLAARAGLYATVCRVLAAGSGAAQAPRVRLHLCGIGIRHPFQVSAEVVRALGRATHIFTNLPDPEVREFLGLFPGRVCSVPRSAGDPNRVRARWIVDRLAPGAEACFVTRIHPFIYRRIGFDLAQLCRERGVSFRAYGAFSLTELSAGLAAEAGSDSRGEGMRIFDISFLNANPDALDRTRPTLVYCIGSQEQRPHLSRFLRRRYPRGHGAFLLGGSGDREFVSPWVPLAGLERALQKADIGCVLYIPAARGRQRT